MSRVMTNAEISAEVDRWIKSERAKHSRVRPSGYVPSTDPDAGPCVGPCGRLLTRLGHPLPPGGLRLNANQMCYSCNTGRVS